MPPADPPPRHPTFFSLPSLALIAPLCVLGALIGTELITTLGITTNTALLGALAGMGLARLPFSVFARYRSPHMQTLAQGAMSAATFGAGNALLLPVGIPFVLGRPDLVGPMLLGAFLAMLVDGWLLYRLFDSPAYPAEAAWPPGMATAEVIRAADEGEHHGAVLLTGLVVGVVGAAYRAPMAAFGAAFIGNPWAMGMFAAGLLLRGHSGLVLDWVMPGADLMRAYVPHGLMIGAGLVALGQMVTLLHRRARPAARALGLGSVAYLAIALLLALAGGLYSHMPPGMLVLFVAFAGFAALLHGLIVALAAMHAGGLPAFGVALIILVIGMLLGFPPAALCLLVGFSAATGPGAGAMGYSLKAGHRLRGAGADPAFEQEGRRQQLHAALFAFAVAGLVVWLSHGGFFADNRVAPAARVYVIVIQAGVSADVAWQLAIWAIPGALIQFLGGATRQLGVLLATGLLLLNPAAGWAVLLGLAVRAIFTRMTKGQRQPDMAVFAAGMIAGDALVSLYDTVSRTMAAKE